MVGVQRVVMSAGGNVAPPAATGRFVTLPNFKFGSRGAARPPAASTGVRTRGLQWVQARGGQGTKRLRRGAESAMASAKLEPSEPSASSSTPARPRLAILALSSGGDRHMAMRCFMRESIKSLLAPGADRPDRRRGAWTGVAGGWLSIATLRSINISIGERTFDSCGSYCACFDTRRWTGNVCRPRVGWPSHDGEG